MNRHELQKMNIATEVLSGLLKTVHPDIFAKALVHATDGGCVWNDEYADTSYSGENDFLKDWFYSINSLADTTNKLKKGEYKKIHDIYLEVVKISPSKDAQYSYHLIFYGEKTISLEEATRILKQLKIRNARLEK